MTTIDEDLTPQLRKPFWWADYFCSTYYWVSIVLFGIFLAFAALAALLIWAPVVAFTILVYTVMFLSLARVPLTLASVIGLLLMRVSVLRVHKHSAQMRGSFQRFAILALLSWIPTVLNLFG